MWVLPFLLSSLGITVSAQMFTDGEDLSTLVMNGIILKALYWAQLTRSLLDIHKDKKISLRSSTAEFLIQLY